MSHWLLRASPKEYDLVGALRAGEPPTRFSIAVHRQRVQAGDHLVFWVPGRDAGVYAIGHVAGRPFEGTGEGPHWTSAAKKAELRTFLPCEITMDLATRPVAKADLRADRRFENALILKMPNGPNPMRLSDEEWLAVLDHAAAP